MLYNYVLKVKNYAIFEFIIVNFLGKHSIALMDTKYL
jgi:hypothetical protein